MSHPTTQTIYADMRASLTEHGLEHNIDNQIAYLEGLREEWVMNKYKVMSDEYLHAISTEITLLSLKLILNHTRQVL
jgi:hypothetical protein